MAEVVVYSISEYPLTLAVLPPSFLAFLTELLLLVADLLSGLLGSKQ